MARATPPRRLLGHIDGVRVYDVDGEWVRDHLDVDFVLGGNPGRYPFVPASQVWVEQRQSARDKAATLVHELVEYRLMQRCGFDYERAHDKALIVERAFRESVERDSRHRDSAMSLARAFLRADARTTSRRITK